MWNNNVSVSKCIKIKIDAAGNVGETATQRTTLAPVVFILMRIMTPKTPFKGMSIEKKTLMRNEMKQLRLAIRQIITIDQAD